MAKKSTKWLETICGIALRIILCLVLLYLINLAAGALAHLGGSIMTLIADVARIAVLVIFIYLTVAYAVKKLK